MDLKSRQERLVFVDPEDEEISYWWPAIVVPEEEYELFKETMDNDAGVNVGEHERLVCYFEDGSFSVVPKSGLIPFNPQREPFKSYSTRLKHFLTDAGVRRAIDFHNSGKIPKMFKWLILAETGYLDPTIESEGDEVQVDGNSDEVIDAVEEVQKPSAAKKQKIVKEPPTTTSTNSTLVVKNKRGRKPKNLTNPESTSEAIASPKPMNPSDMMKIEALISSRMSAESINTSKAVPSEI